MTIASRANPGLKFSDRSLAVKLHQNPENKLSKLSQKMWAFYLTIQDAIQLVQSSTRQRLGQRFL